MEDSNQERAKIQERIAAEECNPNKFTQEQQDSIKELSTYKQFKKGDILIREGQVVGECFHVMTGCLRQYRIIDGEEKTTFFYTENDSVMSLSTGNSIRLATYFVEALEDTEVSTMTAKDEKTLYDRHPEIETLSREALEFQMTLLQNKFSDFMISSPEKRYLNLLETKPQLLDRVPQYHLASYIGVTPESLSRIRKRLAKK